MALVQKAFSDIITFSRSSNATRVGPTGLVEYAPHNLLLQSQTLDNASWTSAANAVTVTANAIAAPDGTVTAEKIVASASAAFHFIRQYVTTPSGCTVSVYMKAGEYTSGSIFLSQSGNNGAVFNLATGAVTSVSGTGNTAAITNVGNGWYRCTVINSGDPADEIRIGPQDGAIASFTGDGTSGIYLWGAQLSVGPYALDYTPTTSAAVYGPRFDYDGSGVTIVEPVSRNLLTYSEQFDNAAWGKSDASVTANTTTAPDGTVTADTLAATNVGYVSTFRIETVVSGNAYTLSVYAKANVTSTLSLEFRGSGSSPDATFNLSNGTVASGTGVISSVGNGWYRCSITKAAVDTSEIVIIGLGTSATIGNSIFIWGAQLEVGSTATGYMVSGATNGFRAVPVVSGSATARGLLVEEQRTNLLTYSEQFDNVAWVKGSFGATQTVTANAGTAPDGTVTAEQVTLSRSNAATDYTFLVQPITLASTAVHAASVYLKAATSGDVGKQVALWQFDGTIKNVALITLTADWQRYSPLTTSTLTSGGSREPLCIGYRTTAEGGGTQTGSVSFFIWGAQAELGSFNTSYIPTLASTVTRSADVASVNTLSPWFNATEGTLFTDADLIGSASLNMIAELGDGGYNNRIGTFGDQFLDSAFIVDAGGVRQVALLPGSFTFNTPFRVAAAYKLNNFAASRNGAAVVTDTSGTVPTVVTLYLGYQGGGGGVLNGHIRRIAYYPRRLTNAELQALTA